MKEQRKAERIKVDLQARWEGAVAQHEGSIVDLSSTGCFILTNDRVNLGELIRIEIELFKDNWVFLWGEVVYQISEMGFALRFTGTDDEGQRALNEYLHWGIMMTRAPVEV